MLRSKLSADTRGPMQRRGSRQMLLENASMRQVCASLHCSALHLTALHCTALQARAALFLVPTLGLNYLLLPIRPAEDSGIAGLYDVLSAVFASFQVTLSYIFSSSLFSLGDQGYKWLFTQTKLLCNAVCLSCPRFSFF
jgi:hypothetical protein